MVKDKHIPTTKEDVFWLPGEEKLKRAFFFVNADSFSKHELWRKNQYGEEEYKLDWVQDSSGFSIQVGNLYRKSEGEYKPMPVMVTCMFAIINGVYVCFYTSDSMVTDWDMVDKFIKKYAGKYDSGRTAMTNSDNFHHCIGYCKNQK